MTNPDAVSEARYVCFQGMVRIAAGSKADVSIAAWQATHDKPDVAVVIFDGTTGKVIDFDLSGTAADIAARFASPSADSARRGRPKLGVVAREVTLLPRHWDWLAAQPGGASVTLRKLIEAARKAEGGDVRARTNAVYQFMVTLAGDLPGFEEASRALFAGDRARLEALMSPWPKDVHDQVLGFLVG